MVYSKNWTEFETAATAIYAKSPNRVRYSVKFKPRTGKLILKLTDDTECVMYKTFSSIILNRFETLNLRLLSQMANLPRQTIPSSSLLPPAGVGQGRAGTPMEVDDERERRAGTPAIDTPAGGKGGAVAGNAGGGAQGGGTPGGTGGKKKKKGKK